MQKESYYFGLHGLKLPQPILELGDGIILRETYASVFAPFMVAFTPPQSPGKHNPGPWTTASGGVTYEITSELIIPRGEVNEPRRSLKIARVILLLLRLEVNPAITLPIFSNLAFSEENAQAIDRTLHVYEVQRRVFLLSVDESAISPDSFAWVRDYWRAAQSLVDRSAEFTLASEAIDQGQFVQNTALTLISLWSALEAIFSPTTSELRFRVSALIASFLEKPGSARRELQKKIAKLYDKRSAAAHGRPKHDEQVLLDTFNLLRVVLMKIIEHGAVPTNDELDAALFGVGNGSQASK